MGKAGYDIVPVVPGKLAEAGRLDALLHKIRTPGEKKRDQLFFLKFFDALILFRPFFPFSFSFLLLSLSLSFFFLASSPPSTTTPLQHSPAWKLELEEYSSRNPDTLVLDPPDRVAALQSRATMLSPLQGRGRRFDPPRAVLDAHAASSSSQSPSSAAAPPPPSPVVVAAPAQVVIPEGASAADALAALAASGLSPPLLAKPLHAGTTACGGSHAADHGCAGSRREGSVRHGRGGNRARRLLNARVAARCCVRAQYQRATAQCRAGNGVDDEPSGVA